MDNTITVALIGGLILLLSNIITAILTARFTTKREKRKWESEITFKMSEYASENIEKLLQLEKKLGIGILMANTRKQRIRKYIIPNNRIQIGRFRTCDIVLDDPKISNEHCAIFSNDKKVFVEDLISTNGTFLNGKRIETKTELKDGDEIQIQNIKIKYKKL